jgi:hypothetical protein
LADAWPYQGAKMRRVITGLDAHGKSTVLYDGPPQSIYHVTSTQVGSLQMTNVPAFLDEVPARQTCVADLWATDSPPRPDDPDLAAVARQFDIQPSGTGLLVRYHVWGAHLDSSTMHATDTLDINVIIRGEVTLLLEEGRSVTLGAGDVVVLPGNQHGWRAGPEGVAMVGIMQRMA